MNRKLRLEIPDLPVVSGIRIVESAQVRSRSGRQRYVAQDRCVAACRERIRTELVKPELLVREKSAVLTAEFERVIAGQPREAIGDLVPGVVLRRRKEI